MPLTPLTGILELRRYRPDDADATASVFYQAVRQSARRDYNQEQVEAWAPEIFDRIAWANARQTPITWVVEHDGVVIGFSDLLPDGLIDMIFVHPKYARRGIGSALLEEVEQSAVELGISRLHTEASLTACSTFVRAGFRIITAQTVQLRGQSFTNFPMEKWLSAAAL